MNIYQVKIEDIPAAWNNSVSQSQAYFCKYKKIQDHSEPLPYILHWKTFKVPTLVQHFKIPWQHYFLEKQYQNYVREQ